MKLILAFLLLFLSFIIAYIAASSLKFARNKTKLLLLLSEKLKANISGQMLSPYKLSEKIIRENYNESIAFSSMEDVGAFLCSEFSDISFITEYNELFKKFSLLSPDELSEYADKLIRLSEGGEREISEKYKKEGKSAFLIFPGIMMLFIIILI